METDNPPDDPRLFLHPTENQLWANAVGDQDPEFPKYSGVMIPICDEHQYESLLGTLCQMLKNNIHIGEEEEEEDGFGRCLANFICIASLGICFCPFLYWSCKKNKEYLDPSQFETKVSTLVSNQTKEWPGKLTIRREIIRTHGEFVSHA